MVSTGGHGLSGAAGSVARVADVATNNPAGRLHALLGKIRSRYESSPDPQARVHSALAVMWDLSWPQERPALLRRVADLDGLSTLVVDQVTALREHPAVDLEDCLAGQDSWHAALEALLNPYGLLRTAGQHVEPSTQRDLARCARLLSWLSPEPDSTEHLQDLALSVSELIQETLRADIDEDVRAFVMENLRTVQDGLARVHLRGSEALHQTADHLLGATLGRGRPSFEKLTHQRPDLARQLWSVLERTAVIVTLVSGVSGTATDVHDLRALLPAQTAATLVESSADDVDLAPSPTSTTPAPTPAVHPEPVASPMPAPVPRAAADSTGVADAEAITKAAKP